MRVRPGLMVFVFTGIVAIVGLACGQSTTPTPVPSQPAAPAAAPTAVATQPPLAAANPTAMPTAVTASAPTPARSPPAQPAPSSANEVRSDIKDFVLEDLTVPVGTTVIWENRDGAPTPRLPAIRRARRECGTVRCCAKGERFNSHSISLGVSLISAPSTQIWLPR